MGSIDVVQLEWDMCPAGWTTQASAPLSYSESCKLHQNFKCLFVPQARGMEGYPTLAFEVNVDHTRWPRPLPHSNYCISVPCAN